MPYSSVIHKADQRLESHGSFYNMHLTCKTEQPLFGPIAFINDIGLNPESKFGISHGTANSVIIPVLGDLLFNKAINTSQAITTEEVLYVCEPGADCTIENGYEQQVIHFLQIGFNSLKPLKQSDAVFPLRLTEYNVLARADKELPCMISLGVYRGRAKGQYSLKNKAHGVFAYVINGAFEIEDRLLENRDGLALWNLEEMEFEALSEQSILMIIETPIA
jgi:hypothetical protein